MPVAKLFVEGRLDVEVLSPILLGNPVVQLGGSKNALRARTRTERHENRVAAGYLRDRDFDYDPPTDSREPTVDATDGDTPFGWRWCRHELENYLIDPAVVCEATGWPAPDFQEALRRAARSIRDYQAVRWAIGIARRALPPHHDLVTRPKELNDIALPAALDAAAVRAWALQSIAEHRALIAAATEPATLEASIDTLRSRFDDAFIDDVSNVLVWFSGKDLLAALADWLTQQGVPSPGAMRAVLRDWCINNPSRVLELLPEWSALVQLLRT